MQNRHANTTGETSTDLGTDRRTLKQLETVFANVTLCRQVGFDVHPEVTDKPNTHILGRGPPRATPYAGATLGRNAACMQAAYDRTQAAYDCMQPAFARIRT